MATCRIAMFAFLAFCGPLSAESEIPDAYVVIAQQAGIPPEALFAVALIESGTPLEHGLRPWPWTLNIAGEPRRFSTRQGACDTLTRALSKTDAKRIDVGLGQTNLGHHPERYESPCDALDPYKNLIVTAQLLKQSRDQSSNWKAAAGRYHRPAGGAPAARYRARFSAELERLTYPSIGVR
ncbi:lytic transglycosylase [Pseudomonas sp. LRF_L74]|uniref:lytic transglycosylase n=1 Tax=Pseudomonas sp. LRF_L74 TaxID=3369422 RepID=UPI003F620CC0